MKLISRSFGRSAYSALMPFSGFWEGDLQTHNLLVHCRWNAAMRYQGCWTARVSWIEPRPPPFFLPSRPTTVALAPAMVVRLFTLTALLLTLMALFFTITGTCADSNHTLLARGRVNANLIYPFYPTSQRERISNLPGRFQYASAEIPECENSFVIRADDPNAGRFAGRRAGGGRRVDICGNK